jgi:signal transduction histidine kinase
MAATTPSQDSVGGLGSLPSTLAVGQGERGGSLVYLRGLVAALMLVALFVAQRSSGDNSVYAWAGTTGVLLIGYVGVTVAWLLLQRTLGERRLFTLLSILLDFCFGIVLSLVSNGLFFPFALLPAFAVATASQLWAGILAAFSVCLFNFPVLLNFYNGAASVSPAPMTVSVIAALLLAIAYTALGWSKLGVYLGLEERSSTLRKSLQAVYKVSYALSASLSYDEVMKAIFKEFGKVLPYGMGMVFLYDNESDRLYIASCYGLDDAERKRAIDATDSIIGKVMRSGTSLIVRGWLRDQAPLIAKAWPRLANYQSAMVVPLRASYEVYGAIFIASEQVGAYGEAQLELLEALTNNAIIALQNAQLYQTISEERDKVIKKEEEVRKGLARDLHDGPAQTLAGITMNLEVLKRMMEVNPNPAKILAEIESVTALARKANHDVRTLLFELRPLILESEGLVAALEQYAQRFLPGETMTLTLDTSRYTTRLSYRVESTLFDVIQEAVGNAKKHAGAHNVLVTLADVGGWASATIHDNGKGFDVRAVTSNYEQRGSFGLLNMRERAANLRGDLNISSAPSSGTTVVITLPTEANG